MNLFLRLSLTLEASIDFLKSLCIVVCAQLTFKSLRNAKYYRLPFK